MAYLDTNKGRGQRTAGQYMGDRGGNIFKSLSRILGGGANLQRSSEAGDAENAFRKALYTHAKNADMIPAQETFYGEEAQAPQTEESMYGYAQDMDPEQIMKLVAMQRAKKESKGVGQDKRVDRLISLARIYLTPGIKYTSDVDKQAEFVLKGLADYNYGIKEIPETKINSAEKMAQELKNKSKKKK